MVTNPVVAEFDTTVAPRRLNDPLVELGDTIAARLTHDAGSAGVRTARVALVAGLRVCGGVTGTHGVDQDAGTAKRVGQPSAEVGCAPPAGERCRARKRVPQFLYLGYVWRMNWSFS